MHVTTLKWDVYMYIYNDVCVKYSLILYNVSNDMF